ncbi:unnamed protein product [Adineta ricciae]|uniref:PKD/REJ-like domain-containing protein n=1 Tax=Adineta ricciae TaxID=249248 RepID=A0A815R3Y3_ADIRI|nr:unnamed protein product [Adineta ricciae]
MIDIISLKLWIFFIVSGHGLTLSYNRPKFSADPIWHQYATTFATAQTVGSFPNDIFISTNNTIYVASSWNNKIIIWNEGNNASIMSISGNVFIPTSVFATTAGEIYIDSGTTTGQIVKWTVNSTNATTVLYTCAKCYDIFIDTSENIYCSMASGNQVVKKSLERTSNAFTVVAGTGSAGNSANMLNGPWGIFVDYNFDLYVADCFNHRVQLFTLDRVNATTVAGNQSTNVTVALSYPTAVILDADSNLFIVDWGNNRIVGSGPNGFRCIVGCTSSPGLTSITLNSPISMSFDTHGNIYVADRNNSRIQKFMLLNNTFVPSYNRPHFCANASWDPNAITFATANDIGVTPYTVFVTIDNTVYALDHTNKRIQVWSNGSTSPTQTIPGAFLTSWTIFTTVNGDIFIDDGLANGRVIKWSSSTNTALSVMPVSGICYGLFVDVNDALYCSGSIHRVVKKWLGDNSSSITLVAGKGIAGSTSNSLNDPRGIFVDDNLDLYVADRLNNRIQLFRLGELNGITVAGITSATATISLYFPTDVILDEDGYLFITDTYNHRILGSGLNGFRCIAGCTGTAGPSPNQLNFPEQLSFDSFGNLFVVDCLNNRIQKFLLLTNSCDTSSTSATSNVPITSTPSSISPTSIGTQPSIITASPSSIVISYNRPKLSAHASWSANAITFANNSTIGLNPSGLFITINNTVYVADHTNSRIRIWSNNSANPMQTIYGSFTSPLAIFVTAEGDLFIDDGLANNQVDKWSSTTNMTSSVMFGNSRCYSLFVDNNNNLYCSVSARHQIITKSLTSNSNTTTVVAGTGCNGSTPNMLNGPWGIFVDTNLDLYVADCYNNRIQLFQPDELNAITVAGNESLNVTVSLYRPTGILLDGDNNLFIADAGNNRIVGSGPNGFRCIVGCSGTVGIASNQLHYPSSISFDTYGNIFVTDYLNNRIQKFILLNETLVPSYNQPIFCANASWDPNAITFANSSVIGAYPFGLFVTTNNTIYIADRMNNRILVWSNGSLTPTQTISGKFNASYTVFVQTNGDIYIDDGTVSSRVEKWSPLTNTTIPVMSVNGPCHGLFVDITDTLYCSMTNYHRIVKRWLGDNSSNVTTVAGTGSAGNTSNALNVPSGIFVDKNLNLYVADRYNHRIQLFRLGQLNGITAVGMTSPNITITLNYPSSVTLDAGGYLFIVDSGNNRIVGSGSDGFRCIVGCTGVPGSASNQLYNPIDISFDTYGNMYTADWSNNRTQKFLYMPESCAYTTKTTTTTKQTTTITLSTLNNSCSPPTITLIPSSFTLSSPARFCRSQDFTIVSLIELNCNTSLSISSQWTITNCTSFCSQQISADPNIDTTFTELFVPARTLPYGLYELNLTVIMSNTTNVSASSVVYVQITPSGITANLVQYGTSMITRGTGQDLQLDPGSYSVDPDENAFNASNWRYKYYCRIYDSSMFPNLQGSLLTVDDPRNDSYNPSCLSNRNGWRFDNSLNSSFTILANSLRSNRTYQFMVQMENRRNASLQATGYVLVKVDDTRPYMILIGCVIWTMCEPNLEFQLVNPTTQVALFSVCAGNYSTVQNIAWSIYFSSNPMNSSSNFTQWSLFNQTASYENIWFFGRNTSNFTAANQLFLSNPQIELWRFEVVYSFAAEKSVSSLNFVINQPPSNGSCFIYPLNGTTATLFTISCSAWFDSDGIKDYTVYIWTNDSTQRMIIGYSSVATLEMYLPVGDDQLSLVHWIVQVRDQLGCITETNVSSVTVFSNLAAINDLINDVQNSTPVNPILQLLASGNQNLVGQLITSISQQFSEINNENLDKAISNGVPLASISVSSLDIQDKQQTLSTPFNQSVLNEFNKQINFRADARDYLIAFLTNLPITTSNSIKLQASSLAQFTKSTNELTRTTIASASNRCYRLALALNSMRTKITYEDVQLASADLLQCASNLMNAVNGALQERTTILNLDSYRATKFPDDYDTDVELEWANLKLFADGDDFSLETMQKNRNIYYQQQLAGQISTQMTELISLLTSTLNIHLNIGQDFHIQTSQVIMTLETKSSQSLANHFTKTIGGGQVQLPNNFASYLGTNEKISIRSIMEPLAPFGNSKSTSNTNLSRSLSFSILNQDQNEVSIQTANNQSIELIIPRDPNLIIPPMIHQNVTSLNSTSPHQLLFYFQYVSLSSSSLAVSVHWEVEPSSTSLAYLFVYRFDQTPQLNTSINHIDGWTLFCPSNLPNDSVYTYYVDNQQTNGHQSIIFGLRELNTTETIQHCSNTSLTHPPITDQPFNFTSDYGLRIYTSGCYYLDENQQWKSDGLVVGPLTNHSQTQCYSTHLTTFAGGFVVLPNTIDWNYVFVNGDFVKNKTVYLTVIVACVIYVVLMICARYYDKEDVQMSNITMLPDDKNDIRRHILQRGGFDVLMSVPKSLGLLNYICKDSLSSWFLKNITLCVFQRWFAVKKHDGKIERALTVANELENSQFARVHRLRDERSRKMQMCSVIHEIMLRACFLSVVYVLIYSSRNSNAFHQVHHLRRYFLNPTQADLDYTKISTVGDLRAQQWCNGDRQLYAFERQNQSSLQDECDILIYVENISEIDSFKKLTKIGTQAERDLQNRGKCHCSVKHFSGKMDQLLIDLNQIYTDNK